MNDPTTELVRQVLGALVARESDETLRVSFSELKERRSVEVHASPEDELIEVRLVARKPLDPSSNAHATESDNGQQ